MNNFLRSQLAEKIDINTILIYADSLTMIAYSGRCNSYFVINNDNFIRYNMDISSYIPEDIQNKINSVDLERFIKNTSCGQYEAIIASYYISGLLFANDMDKIIELSKNNFLEYYTINCEKAYESYPPFMPNVIDCEKNNLFNENKAIIEINGITKSIAEHTKEYMTTCSFFEKKYTNDYLRQIYSFLWCSYIKENIHLVETLKDADVITDRHMSVMTDNSPANVLTWIVEDGLDDVFNFSKKILGLK